MAESRKLYVDMLSQPSRALSIFCRSTNILVQEIVVNIAKGEHRTPEYRTVNPVGKLPSYSEAGFTLSESVAIMKYLVATNRVADHWHPADPRKRALVDSACDWHHNSIRRGTATLILNRIFLPRAGKPFNQSAAKEAEDLLIASLKTLERYWLKSTPFVLAQEISIADLLMVTELDMLHLLSGDDQGKSREEILAPFKNVTAWMQRVADTCQPHHKEVSELLMRASAKGEQSLKAKRSKL